MPLLDQTMARLGTVTDIVLDWSLAGLVPGFSNVSAEKQEHEHWPGSSDNVVVSWLGRAGHVISCCLFLSLRLLQRE